MKDKTNETLSEFKTNNKVIKEVKNSIQSYVDQLYIPEEEDINAAMAQLIAHRKEKFSLKQIYLILAGYDKVDTRNFGDTFRDT